ncbi:SHOCT domain-containing protein [Ihubacter sp. mB4P-1]|uniref:SHOCT domain-containing protein n=1 Tax=Ihubacter sp. mB4P-1 TaxID=3242370 RepID=UPI003C7E502D
MRKMRTAEEMLAYYRENVEYPKRTGLFGEEDPEPKDELFDYKYLISLLDDDEYVITFFWGYIFRQLHRQEHKEINWTYIFTNKRLIAKCTEAGWQMLRYKQINNILVNAEYNEVYFDTDGWYRGLADVNIYHEDIDFIKHEIAEVMPYIREIQEKEAQKKKFSGSPAEEIRRFKELCDDGIITEEEFEDRKRELLKFKYVD